MGNKESTLPSLTVTFNLTTNSYSIPIIIDFSFVSLLLATIIAGFAFVFSTFKVNLMDASCSHGEGGLVVYMKYKP